MPDKPRMVDRWRLGGSFQPVLIRDVRMYGFLVRADPAHLAQEYLNGPSQGALGYSPCLPFALITFTQMSRVSAAEGEYANVGWATETDVTIWVFTRRGLHPLMFAPYIFVDLPLAIYQGREIYGFPKEVGWFDKPAPGDWHKVPADGSQADAFTVKVFGTKKFDREQPFAPLPLLEVRRAPSETLASASTWESFSHAVREIGRVIEGLEGIAEHTLGAFFAGERWPPVGTTVLLKQIWDAEDGRFACHQSIVEADISPVGWIKGWRLGGDYELTVHPLASHPLHRDLGLDAGQTTFPCLFGYWMDFSFQVGSGRTMWTAG